MDLPDPTLQVLLHRQRILYHLSYQGSPINDNDVVILNGIGKLSRYIENRIAKPQFIVFSVVFKVDISLEKKLERYKPTCFFE